MSSESGMVCGIGPVSVVAVPSKVLSCFVSKHSDHARGLTWFPITTIWGSWIASDPTVLKTSWSLFITGINPSMLMCTLLFFESPLVTGKAQRKVSNSFEQFEKIFIWFEIFVVRWYIKMKCNFFGMFKGNATTNIGYGTDHMFVAS